MTSSHLKKVSTQKPTLAQRFHDEIPLLWQEPYATVKALSDLKTKFQNALQSGAKRVELDHLMQEYQSLFSHLYDAISSDFSGYAYVINTGMCAPKILDVQVREGVLAGALAHELGFDESTVSDMVLVGLLHDVGELQSGPPPKRQSSSNKNFIAWQAALAKRGADMLANARVFSDGVIRGVASQFERNNGEGFPLGLSGKNIPRESRILHVTRTYCHKLGNGRMRLCPHDALSLLFFDFRDFYDDDYLMCFLRLLGVYPVGTYVEIENAQLGVVVQRAENIPNTQVVIMNENVVSGKATPILVGDMNGKITGNIPPYVVAQMKKA